MKISEALKKIILEHENEIDTYQFEGVYSKLESGKDIVENEKDIATFTEMMLSVGVDPAKHLGYIPYSYLHQSKIEKYDIPNSVVSIGLGAFKGCSGLTNITIPDSVTSIEEWAFSNCSGLTGVTIGDGVKSIEWGAFSGCSGLTSITIPDSVTGIGAAAFYECNGLTSVTIGTGVTSIGKYAFDHCYELKDVNYNGTVKQWKNIKICEEAFPSTPPIIHCTDGEA